MARVSEVIVDYDDLVAFTKGNGYNVRLDMGRNIGHVINCEGSRVLSFEIHERPLHSGD